MADVPYLGPKPKKRPHGNQSVEPSRAVAMRAMQRIRRRRISMAYQEQRIRELLALLGVERYERRAEEEIGPPAPRSCRVVPSSRIKPWVLDAE